LVFTPKKGIWCITSQVTESVSKQVNSATSKSSKSIGLLVKSVAQVSKSIALLGRQVSKSLSQ
jgi:hypothetical protein